MLIYLNKNFCMDSETLDLTGVPSDGNVFDGLVRGICEVHGGFIIFATGNQDTYIWWNNYVYVAYVFIGFSYIAVGDDRYLNINQSQYGIGGRTSLNLTAGTVSGTPVMMMSRAEFLRKAVLGCFGL